MKKIYISLNGKDLGYLKQEGNMFVFVADETNISKTERDNPFAMKLFKLNKTGINKYSTIPENFAQFMISKYREDILEKAEINENDDQFEILYKLAGLDMMQINFKIHQ